MALFLIGGISGAGKSHLTDVLGENFAHVKGDDLTRHLNTTYFPKAKHAWNPHLLNKVLPNNEVHFYSPDFALMEYLEEKLLPRNGDFKHVLVEGVIVHTEFWRRKIQEAFFRSRLNFGHDVFLIFHNPPAELILDQYLDRRAKVRKEAKEWTLEDVTRQQKDIGAAFHGSGPNFFETDSTEASIAKIRSLAGL